MYWIQTLKLGDIHSPESDILSKRWTLDNACYRLRDKHPIEDSYSCMKKPSNSLYAYWPHLNLVQSPSREAWKVPPSPSRLVAKSGAWIAVAANILCTLLPSGSWPNLTI